MCFQSEDARPWRQPDCGGEQHKLLGVDQALWAQAVREQVEHDQGRRVRQPRQPQRTQSFTQQDHHDWREVLQESKQFESFEAGQQHVGRLERSCLLSGQPQMAQRLDEQPSGSTLPPSQRALNGWTSTTTGLSGSATITG